MNFKIFFIAIISLLCCFETFAEVSKKDSLTRITSDIIDIKRKSQTIDFIGNVIVKRATETLFARKMIIFYQEKNAPNPNNIAKEGLQQNQKQTSIKRMEAYDDVKVLNGEISATGDIGHYDPQENIFVLERNVIVNNGSSIGRGEKFI